MLQVHKPGKVCAACAEVTRQRRASKAAAKAAAGSLPNNPEEGLALIEDCMKSGDTLYPSEKGAALFKKQELGEKASTTDALLALVLSDYHCVGVLASR